MSDSIRVTALGGSGENGRNCFAVRTPAGVVLLDCGVKREIADGEVGGYPALTAELVSEIAFVFLSHCHEDHCAALPLLYEHGYRGAVYASPETAAMAPAFLEKWACYVESNGGTLPFARQRIEQVRFEPMALGAQRLCGLTLRTGRSGHVLGGMWLHIEMENRSLLYTGDMVRHPLLLKYDPPPASDGAIINAAYAGKTIDARRQLDRLVEATDRAVGENGIVLLPVPPKGRGCDLLHVLPRRLPLRRFCVERSIADSYAQLMRTDWVCGDASPDLPGNVEVVADRTQTDRVLAEGGLVYLTGDGMLSTEDSRACFELVKQDPNNLVIVTGHAAAGTAAAGLFDRTYRQAHDVRCAAEKIVCKAHLDDGDVMELATGIGAEAVVLFHADAGAQQLLMRSLAQRGVRANCVRFPQWMAL